MKKIMICAILLSTLKVYSQKKLDTRINITVVDTSGLYEKTRLAFINEEIMIVDNRRTDTLSTYPYNIKSTTYILTYAAIKNNTVTLWGYLADANVNMLGITVNPSKKNYEKIFYYPKDKYWKKLMKIALRIPGTISYDKE